MENPKRITDAGQKRSFTPNISQAFFSTDRKFRYEMFGQGGDGSYRLVLLSLGLLNVVLLIIAVVIGISCVRITEGSHQVSQTELIKDLNHLRSNHSDVIKAEEEAKNALKRALKNHAQMKVQIEKQKTINDNYHRQFEALRTEKINLQSNISALEGSCRRCLSGWIHHNSSCYFFSSTESSTVKKSWIDSRADCNRRGADLVVIDNQEEQKFLTIAIENMKDSNPSQWIGYWIGLTDSEFEGQWVWINNVTEVEQRYWMDGEPNNVGHTGENCACIAYSSSNPWKTRWDANCNRPTKQWICEM